jgi:TetR/AcrR family transcriptional regulator
MAPLSDPGGGRSAIEVVPEHGKCVETPKRKRDAGLSRESILQAAMEEFSAHGFDGARIDAIVKRAGVSKNLAYHYFGGKEDLFLHVMERMYARMRAHHEDLRIKDLPPIEGMSRLVRHTFAHFRDHPEVISLLNSENLHKAAHIKGSRPIAALYSTLTQVIRDLLDRGVKEGVFRPNIDPMDLYISISGVGYFYLSNQHTLGSIFQRDLVAPERLKVREEHLVEVILGYLRA